VTLLHDGRNIVQFVMRLCGFYKFTQFYASGAFGMKLILFVTLKTETRDPVLWWRRPCPQKLDGGMRSVGHFLGRVSALSLLHGFDNVDRADRQGCGQ